MQSLTAALKSTKEELTGLVNSLHENETDTIPFEGSWTAGQLLEHVNKAVGPEIIKGNVQSTDRPADEKVETIKSIFLDFTIKMISPDFIEPTETVHDKNVLLNSIAAKFDQLIIASETMNLQEECLDFEVPGMGKFTRLEWIYFYMVHSQRHLRQLKNIIKVLHTK
jgi:hypothetical protein